MAVRASVSRFPVDQDAQERSGLLWGVTVTPFAAKDEDGSPPSSCSDGHLLPRCENCWGYFNTYCDLDQWSWSCALCGSLNGLSVESISRYSLPQSCPELMSSFVDLKLPDEERDRDEAQPRPVYVAAVDLSSSEEFLELTKSSLLASLEALGPGSLFGLATFSHKLGLYDVQGPIPIVKNVFIHPDPDHQVQSVELDDVMPLLSFLAPIETCKDRIVTALETLKPSTSWERGGGTPSSKGIDGVLLYGRGFGAAIELLVNYLEPEYGHTFALARVFAFLSGPPDYGAGQLDTRRYGEQYASKGEDADLALLPEQTPFYRDLVSASISSPSPTNTQISLLSSSSASRAEAHSFSIQAPMIRHSLRICRSFLPKIKSDDNKIIISRYRMLSRPYAFRCIMRLRTSSEYKQGHSYGHFFPDPKYENVQHVVCCDSHTTYSYDFDFSGGSGFSRNASERPMMQMAFQYSIVVPREDVGSSGSRYALERRIRVRTLQFSTAGNAAELYDNVDAEVVLSLLVHKVIGASLEQGVREGRALLYDWLVMLTVQYNDAYKLVAGSSSETVDVAFSRSLALQPLPRLAFALLRSPLLRLHEEGVHPDHRIYLQCLFSALEPGCLHRAVYPLLVSYSTPDEEAYPRHSLSRAALVTSGSPIFLLDAFTTLVVFYSSTADPALPFPPPQHCRLRARINSLKKERSITPKLFFVRAGRGDATIFENYLVEEQDADGSGSVAFMGFVSFLRDLTQSVLQYVK